MFESIGLQEMIVIAGVALIILGPEKFPGHAKIALRFMRDIRNYWDEAKRDLADELKPIQKELRELGKYKAEDYLDALTDGKSEDIDSHVSGFPYGDAPPISDSSSGGNQTGQTISRSELTPWKPVEGVEPYGGEQKTGPEPPSEPDYTESEPPGVPEPED